MMWEGGRDLLDLAELSRMSRVSRRTIRYYIHQGLLPSPGKRGRGARYDRAVLDRLELIKVLQRDGWPLGKIAERLASLDDAAVRRAVEEGGWRKGEGGEPVTPSLLPSSSFLLPQRSTWERVRIGDDIELSVRAQVPARKRKVVEQLIETAKEMLADEDYRA